MPVDERLRAWNRPTPDVDSDALLGRVRRTVRRRRQRRAAVGFGAVVLALVTGGFWAVGGEDDADVDTVGRKQTAPVRYLPENVIEGFTLAWVDDREQPMRPPSEPNRWDDGTASAYAYGYRSDGVEIDVDLFPGYALDTAEVARAWQDETPEVQVLSEEVGAGAVVMETNGMQHGVIEIDGAVVRVATHGLEDEDSTVRVGELVSFVRSFRTVDEDTWTRAIEPADVAPPFGRRGSGRTVIDGGDWQLLAIPYRPPRWVTGEALILRVHGDIVTNSQEQPAHLADRAVIHDDIELELFPHDGGTIVWGLAPPDAAVVRLWFVEGTVEAKPVPFGRNTAFAVEVGDVTGLPRTATVLDARGEQIHGQVNPGAVIHCADEGDPTTVVPNVIGIELADAIRLVETAGLAVRGTGTPPGDPIEDTTVIAQEPPAGTQVPSGACISFRTK